MARPKLGEGDTQRLHVMISEDELTAIDDWRFANRIGSRSEAVRRLIQIGISADEELAKTLEQSIVAYEEALSLKEGWEDLFRLREGGGLTTNSFFEGFMKVSRSTRQLIPAVLKTNIRVLNATLRARPFKDEGPIKEAIAQSEQARENAAKYWEGQGEAKLRELVDEARKLEDPK